MNASGILSRQFMLGDDDHPVNQGETSVPNTETAREKERPTQVPCCKHVSINGRGTLGVECGKSCSPAHFGKQF